MKQYNIKLTTTRNLEEQDFEIDIYAENEEEAYARVEFLKAICGADKVEFHELTEVE